MGVLQGVVSKRREERRENPWSPKKDMMDQLLDAEDESGRRLDDEEIIDILVMYLNAGHESSGHITMWAAVFLQNNPQMFQKAKVVFLISHPILILALIPTNTCSNEIAVGARGNCKKQTTSTERVDTKRSKKNGLS